MKKVLLILFILIPLVLPAQQLHRRYQVFFGEARVDYPGPEKALREFADSSAYYSVTSIDVNGYASPSGRHAFNVWLGNRRAEVVASSLGPLFPGVPLSSAGHGEDWTSLRSLVGSSDIKGRSVVLDILDNTPFYVFDAEGRIVTGRKKQLMDLNRGRTYNLLFKEFFPYLRRTDIDITYTVRRFSDYPDSVSNILLGRDTPRPFTFGIYSVGLSLPEQDRGRDAFAKASGSPLSRFGGDGDAFYYTIPIVFRSNLLVPLMNIGVEVPVGKRFSVDADVVSPWIGFDWKNSMCFQLQGLHLEGRYWLNPDSLPLFSGNTFTGHSVAIGAMAYQYDFEKDYYGHQGEVYGAYADYTYTKYLKKYLRLQLSIALGYAFCPWRDYNVYEDSGKLLRSLPVTEHYNQWFGPMKAAVSLAVPVIIAHNIKKGGQAR